jgi:hypothetical protein
MYFSNSVLDNLRTICTADFLIPIKWHSGQTVMSWECIILKSYENEALRYPGFICTVSP